MARAILAGRKTQTRRIVKLADFGRSDTPGYLWTYRDRAGRMHDIRLTDALVAKCCPYGQPGDRLWVRETWADGHSYDGKRHFAYRADGVELHPSRKWKPSIHMPRAASRITLEITGVRVERLQEISADDARAEGCPDKPVPGAEQASVDAFAREWYADLWESINGPGSWYANPWVWVVEFRRA